jgi:hypothetical protein
MTKKQINIRPTDHTQQQLADLKIKFGGNITATIADAIDAKWRNEFKLSFNRACTEMGICDDREQFHIYVASKRDAINEHHPLNVWEIIHRCYETSRDAADHDNTQQDALT